MNVAVSTVPFVLPLLASCGRTAPRPAGRKAVAIPISFVPATSTEGFLKHWTLGSKSAWYSMERHEVLILDAARQTIVRLKDLPRDYGRIVATGWEHDKDFFIHFSLGADEGTMAYLDLNRQMIVALEHWAAW
jgi:hypothetical protein